MEDLNACKIEGRDAFRTHGVTGESKNPYSDGSQSHRRLAFYRGFVDERFEAAERSQKSAASYHALSVRDNAIDRKWAARLSGAAA